MSTRRRLRSEMLGIALLACCAAGAKAGWTQMEGGMTTPVHALWGSSGSDVFAVGYVGIILHYDGTSWSPMTSGTVEALWSIWGSSGTDVFAVGDPEPSSTMTGRPGRP
jgi:hypothetical protein